MARTDCSVSAEQTLVFFWLGMEVVTAITMGLGNFGIVDAAFIHADELETRRNRKKTGLDSRVLNSRLDLTQTRHTEPHTSRG